MHSPARCSLSQKARVIKCALVKIGRLRHHKGHCQLCRLSPPTLRSCFSVLPNVEIPSTASVFQQEAVNIELNMLIRDLEDSPLKSEMKMTKMAIMWVLKVCHGSLS